MTRCEDYPCCGHTDGLGCNWTPESVHNDPHLLCDHEVGVCEVEPDEYDHDYDLDDTRDGVPWCYGCDDYARCGEYEPDGAPVHQWEVTDPFQYAEPDARDEHDPTL